MLDPVTMFRDGGPFMYLLLLIGMASVPCMALWTLGVGAAKARIPASLSWVVLVFAALMGLLGTYFDVDLTYQAVAHASAEMVDKMTANGLAVSLYTMVAALWVAVPGLLSVPLLACLPAVAGPGPDAELDLASIGSTIGGAVMGGAGGLVLVVLLVGLQGLGEAGPVWMVIPLAVVLLVPMLIASARFSPESEHRGRIAGTRFLMGTAAFFGLGFAGELFSLMGQILALQATAYASPEMQDQLVAQGLVIAGSARWIGWGAALMPGFAGWFGAIPHVEHIGTRQMIGAAIAGAQVLVIAGCIGGALFLTQS